MRQILLRVPDDLHRRLAERAAEGGRSINALATTILDTAIGDQRKSRRARLRARATALNLLPTPETTGTTQTPRARQAALDSTRGLGRVLDQILDEDRDRR